METEAVNHLTYDTGFVFRPVFEDRGKGIGIRTAILPLVDPAVSDHIPWTLQAAEPVNGINLMGHPLAKNPAGIRPEKAVFQVFAGIPPVFGTAHQEPAPVGIGLPDAGYQIRSAPASRLIHIPAHFHNGNGAELSGLNEFGRRVVIGSASTLGTHLKYFIGSLDRFQRLLRVTHGFCKGLFTVHVAVVFYGFNRMVGMLEVRCSNDDRVQILYCIQFIVVYARLYRMAYLLGDVGCALFPAAVPDVRHGNEIKIERFA